MWQQREIKEAVRQGDSCCILHSICTYRDSSLRLRELRMDKAFSLTGECLVGIAGMVAFIMMNSIGEMRQLCHALAKVLDLVVNGDRTEMHFRDDMPSLMVGDVTSDGSVRHIWLKQFGCVIIDV